MSNSEDSLAADVASELGERLALERGGNAAVDCKCEAVGVDGENRYLECTYEVTERESGRGLSATSDDKTDLGKNNNVNGKVNAMQSTTAAAPVAVELLLRKQQHNKKQQGVVAVKVP